MSASRRLMTPSSRRRATAPAEPRRRCRWQSSSARRSSDRSARSARGRRLLRVVAEAHRARGEVDEAPVARGHGTRRVVEVVAGGQLDAAAATAMEQPQLAGRNARALWHLHAARRGTRRREPRRAAHVGSLLAGDRTAVLPVGVDEPEVLHPVLVGRERDGLAVGRVARVIVVGRPACERRRRSASDRHGVEVAQHVEYQRCSVRRHVDRHPRAFGRLEDGVRGVGPGRVDVGRRVFRRRLAALSSSVRP